MTANPILYILGIEGHIYTARALTEEFKCPVVGVITTQRMQELFTEEDKKVFSKLYSFPNFYFENITQSSGSQSKN